MSSLLSSLVAHATVTIEEGGVKVRQMWYIETVENHTKGGTSMQTLELTGPQYQIQKFIRKCPSMGLQVIRGPHGTAWVETDKTQDELGETFDEHRLDSRIVDAIESVTALCGAHVRAGEWGPGHSYLSTHQSSCKECRRIQGKPAKTSPFLSEAAVAVTAPPKPQPEHQKPSKAVMAPFIVELKERLTLVQELAADYQTAIAQLEDLEARYHRLTSVS